MNTMSKMSGAQPPSFAVLALAVSLLGVATGLSCAGPSASTEVGPETDVEAPPVDREDGELFVVEESPGHLRLHGPIDGLQAGDLVELVPKGPWPASEVQRPTQAVVMVATVEGDSAAVVLIGQRDHTLDFDHLTGRRGSTREMAFSKSLTSVVQRDERSVRLAARPADGVVEGDWFFILGEPHGDPRRLGSYLVALVRVTEASPTGARAQIIHEMAPIEEGAAALFAHHASPEAERPEALILFARTDPTEAPDSFRLPPLASAVVDYQFEFQFSNVRIETIDEFIDPRPYDAVDRAQSLAPEEGFGVIVFGEEQPDRFLYNITTFGASPSLATTVGILPGGLPLPAPGGLEGLSTQLAPSFLATALAQRGDHAETIYFLEYVLRNRDISLPVAFHLREHLALRYEAIGRPYEGLWLMTEDIRQAVDTENVYAQLNALSIREYLNRTQEDYDLELADLDRFLAVARGVLPDESLLAERLERSRVLSRQGRQEEALDLVDEVILQAQRQEDLDFEVSATLTRANLLFQAGDVEGAIDAATGALSDARLLGDPYPHYTHTLLARFFAENENYESALSNVHAALAYASTEGSSYAIASTYELAANLHYAFDAVPEAVVNMREAARFYERAERPDDEGRASLQAGLMEIMAASTQTPEFLLAGYGHLASAAQSFMTVGDGRSAAQAYGGMGFVNTVMRDTRQALVNFGRSIDLGQAFAEPTVVAMSYYRSAELYALDGDIQQSQTALDAARLWASTFGLGQLMGDIERLETSLQDAI